MEVLEEGKDVEWKREITCPHCKSRILITATDIMCNGSFLPDYYVICHGHRIDLIKGVIHVFKGLYIPENVKLNAQWRAEQRAKLRNESIRKNRDKEMKKLAIWFVSLVIVSLIIYILLK
ncbi:hypothetical protein KAS31_02300 [Candidatus Parcubacteria bacterium]|nr:hypothetical protein [Candidatus Parcubacteria bacterium]